MKKVNLPVKGAGRRLAKNISDTDAMLEQVLAVFDDKDAPKQRKAANKKLLTLLKRYLVDNPEQRFGQALVNAGFIARNHVSACHDEFYVESRDTLKRVKIALAAMREHHR